MSITQKTEDEVVIALHDNGLDISLTIEALLEGPQVYLIFNFFFTNINYTGHILGIVVNNR